MPENHDRRLRRETWTITFGFTALDEPHARTAAQHAARRLATVLPDFDKNMIALARESDPFTSLSGYCADDIHCVLPPEHTGACRDHSGTDLDLIDYARDGAPTFGCDL